MKKRIRQELNRLGAKREPFLFAIDYEQSELILVKEPLQKHSLYFDINGVYNGQPVAMSEAKAVMEAMPPSYAEYQARFGVISEALHRGDSFLANLTMATPIMLNIGLEQVFVRAQAKYKLYVPGRFVCFSPECFVAIRNNKIFSYPMKGTIDAAVPDAANVILNDYKETAEHYTIVDLIRNDLSMVSEGVTVAKFRYIDKLHTNHGTLLQVSSEIAGELPADWHAHLGDILCPLLPAGSISGAPKEATVEAIWRAEQMPRGFYTGIFGYYDGQSLDSGVMIRFIEQCADGTYRYRSGGGITINSVPEEEYHEVCEKVYLPFQ